MNDTPLDDDAQLSGLDLQPTIDRLLQAERALSRYLDTETRVEVAQQVGRTQARLRSLAGTLVVQQIDLVANDAGITAQHINDASAYALRVIERIAGWKARVKKLGALIEFLGVVMTGHGGHILQAAIRLRRELDAAT